MENNENGTSNVLNLKKLFCPAVLERLATRAKFAPNFFHNSRYERGRLSCVYLLFSLLRTVIFRDSVRTGLSLTTSVSEPTLTKPNQVTEVMCEKFKSRLRMSRDSRTRFTTAHLRLNSQVDSLNSHGCSGRYASRLTLVKKAC